MSHVLKRQVPASGTSGSPEAPKAFIFHHLYVKAERGKRVSMKRLSAPNCM